ncbi:hypothetical protein I6F30_16310 [Bradyrhizobium sp. NBAIM20]|uniref:hypothetical protein n=1 Tax=unclassified Bradyrhizobium TaxID=2631580 RepID=UPI001CD64E1B|nr:MULTISPECIES: hypothetical protein [unclassified Bradyrhizobium]MCA1412685.1 hypothetical protein [Bradyrhizobium sp. NBAIM20]MCA1463465.1 hypothetical protein [Bradyrhizobium sp. NBAIM18]
MPNLATGTTVASPAVASLDSPVNVVVRLLKHIAERIEDVGERVSLGCGMALGELEVFEPFDLGDELNDRRKALEADLVEIETAVHDLDELVGFIKEVTS